MNDITNCQSKYPFLTRTPKCLCLVENWCLWVEEVVLWIMAYLFVCLCVVLCCVVVLEYD